MKQNEKPTCAHCHEGTAHFWVMPGNQTWYWYARAPRPVRFCKECFEYLQENRTLRPLPPSNPVPAGQSTRLPNLDQQENKTSMDWASCESRRRINLHNKRKDKK